MRLILFTFALFVLSTSYIQGQSITIVPDRDIQDQIEKAERAYVNAFSTAHSESKKVVCFYEELAKLHVMARRDRVRFVRQLLYYDVNKSHDESWRLYLRFCAPFYVLGIGRQALAEAIVPLLKSDDKRIARGAKKWLKAIEAIGKPEHCDQFVDFSPYRHLIHPESPPEALIRYLYYRSPFSAIALMVKVYSKGNENKYCDVIWADHVVRMAVWEIRNGFENRSDSIARANRQLEMLSQHREWWVRLYAAVVVTRYPHFRRESLIRRLQEDPHPLVREVLDRALRNR